MEVYTLKKGYSSEKVSIKGLELNTHTDKMSESKARKNLNKTMACIDISILVVILYASFPKGH